MLKSGDIIAKLVVAIIINQTICQTCGAVWNVESGGSQQITWLKNVPGSRRGLRDWCGGGAGAPGWVQSGGEEIGKKQAHSLFMEVVENRFLIPTRWTAWTPPGRPWRAPWTEAFSGALPLYPWPRNIVFLIRRVYCNFVDPVTPTPIPDNSYDALLCCAGFFQVGRKPSTWKYCDGIFFDNFSYML